MVDKVVARVAIHRRVGDKMHVIAPGTTFEPQSEDEAAELKKANAIFESQDEKSDYERATEGVFRRNRPGITETHVPLHLLRAEAAHNADVAAGLAPGEGPVGDTSATDAVAVRRAARAKAAASPLV